MTPDKTDCLSEVLGVQVDTSGEPWVAQYPGLGTVEVMDDGCVAVMSVAGRESQQRADALRWGWAEPLSWLRRGYHLTSAVVADVDNRAMVVSGPQRQTLIVMKAMSEHGWYVLSDSLTPVREEESGFIARGRLAPVLVPEDLAQRWELSGERVRGDSDVLAVELPRSQAPARISAVLHVDRRKLGDSGDIEMVAGAKRLKMSCGLVHRGPERPAGIAASTVMARDLWMAQLPAARICLDESAVELDVAEIVGWWRQIGPADE